jgi:cell division protein FtsQ
MRTRKNRRKSVKQRVRLPRMPRFEINFKALLVPPLAVAATIGAAWSAQQALDKPIGAITIEGSFQRVSAVQIEAAMAPELDRGFLSVDLAALRRRIEALDWTDEVEIGRLWPDRLVVRVTEHRAAARWGDSGLLNVRGELFTETSRHPFPELPSLIGPEGSEHDVARWYLAVRGRLAQAHLGLDSLSMDARGALHLLLDGGLEVRLGRRAVDERLDRFFEVVAPALAEDLPRIDYVDLRYTNGFAVGWLPADDTEVVASQGGPNSG